MQSWYDLRTGQPHGKDAAIHRLDTLLKRISFIQKLLFRVSGSLFPILLWDF